MAECRQIRGGCPTGQAVATGAGNLPAKKVIHAVGPVWYGGRKGEEDLLASAYAASLNIAMQEGCRSVAFPSLSTGAYRFPIQSATAIALQTVVDTVKAHPEAFDEIRFTVFSDSDLQVYENALSSL
jgi:O-acetyl-ADP-ribose deacetylase (regulator of RNase III)